MKKAAVAGPTKCWLPSTECSAVNIDYVDPGADYLDRLHPERTTKRLVQRLEQLGLDVVVRARSTA